MFTIAYDPSFAPITFRGRHGEAEGEAVRRIAAACAGAGVACRFEPAALADQDRLLAGREVDALAAVAATPERANRFALSRPFLETGAAWFSPVPFDPSRAPDATPVTTPAAGPLVAVLGAKWPRLQIVPASSYLDALQRVLAGQAVAAALNIDAGRQICARDFPGCFVLPDAPFLAVELAIACLKGAHDGVLARLSAAIATGKQGLLS